MKTKLLIIAVGLIVLSSWIINQNSNIKRAEWLLHTWEFKTTKGSIYESWKKVSDMEYSAKSYKIKGMDTLVFETISLMQEGEGLFYVPTVKSQNNNLPVRFALKTISDTSFVFENPDHDFPQVISYSRVTKDSLVAEISGLVNGIERKQVIPMKRVE